MFKLLKVRSKPINILYNLSLLFLWIYPFINIFTVTFVDGHDFSFHLWRILALKKEIDLGNWLPTWIADGLDGFGVPIFSIIYGVPYYIAVVLLKIGLSLPMAQKIMMFIPGPLSGLFFYIWAKNKFGKIAGGVGSIIYVWTPYHFLATFIRGTIGEIYFFMFFPLVLIFLDKTTKRLAILGGAVSFALLIYSHNSLALLSVFIYIGYILITYIQAMNISQLVKQILIIITGILLAAFYTLPALIFTPLLHNSKIVVDDLVFPPPLSLLRSKWEGGSIIGGQNLIMSFQIGWANLIIILISLCVIIIDFTKSKRRSINWHLLFWFGCLLLSVFMLFPISRWVWGHIPLLINIQFPYRILAIIMIETAVLAGILVAKIKNKPSKIFLAVFLTLLALVGNRHHLLARQKNITVTELKSYHGSYDGSGEFLPSYFDYPTYDKLHASGLSVENVTIENGRIIDFKRELYMTQARVEMYEPGRLFIKRLYFPGWSINVNGKKISEFEKGNGVWVPLSKGVHEVVAEYKIPAIIKVSRMTALLVFIILITLSIIKPKGKNEKVYAR